MAEQQIQRVEPPHERQIQPTMPQGTQAYGVERGHEGGDVHYGTLGRWVLGLVGALVVFQVVLFGMFGVLKRIVESQDNPPSALFTQRKNPPEPRLLPNPADYREHPNRLLRGPGDAMRDEAGREDRELERLGLLDRHSGDATMPGAAERAVIGEASRGAARAPSVSPAASGSSGGTAR
ncbi:MAG TPA: hypothetical protein VGN26_16070 [Armatimonadota bacterium]|jgi:hypothetical protein